MRITGCHSSLPFHVARAYGVKSTAPANALVVQAPPASINPPTRAETHQSSRGAQQLVAAKVSQPVAFDAAPPRQSIGMGSALQMYTRAADRIEAATGVHIGQRLDLKG